MYKFIVGTVKVLVLSNTIPMEEAKKAAREEIALAASQGKILSHIEISQGPDGLERKCFEREADSITSKSLRQSILDGMYYAVKEKLFPPNAAPDVWYDADTNQEWRGAEVPKVSAELLKKFEEWKKSQEAY